MRYKKRYKITGPIVLEPRCMPAKGSIERRMQAAITNRGELIPCCWFDQTRAREDPVIRQMYKVSKINEHNSIEDILKTKEWQEFAKNLAEKNLNKVRPICIYHCKRRTGEDRQKVHKVT